MKLWPINIEMIFKNKFCAIAIIGFMIAARTTMAQPVVVGAFVGVNPPSAMAIRHYEAQSGHSLDSVSWYQGWNDTYQPSFPAKALDKALLLSQTRDMRFVQLTFEPWVALSDISTGIYDAYLTRYATAIKAWNKPLVLRFAHEMIQDGHYDHCQNQPSCPEWYPWQDQPADYIAAFQHVVTVFRKVQATKVQFVWNPNNTPSDFDTVRVYYPGSAYVDWLGIDGYNWTNQDNLVGIWPDWQWFDDIFYNLYHTFLDHSEFFGNKPIMIGELASCEATYDTASETKATWINNAFSQIQSENYSQVRAFYWFNVNNTSEIPTPCNWQIDSSADSLAAFRDAMASF